jgi:outer membrane protein assembly factor BamE
MKDPLLSAVKTEDSGIRPQMQKSTSALKSTLPSTCTQPFYKIFAALIGMIFSLLIISGCSFPGVYRINVQQGTIVTQEMLSQLKPGMTTKQVRYVLGTPSAPNTFSADEDTYYYSFQKGNDKIASQVIAIHYDATRHFTHYTGDPLQDQPAY